MIDGIYRERVEACREKGSYDVLVLDCVERAVERIQECRRG